MRILRFILITVVTFPLIVSAAPDSTYMKGYNFPSWWHDSYLQSWSDESLDNMIKDGAPSWIAIGPFWYQHDASATTIYANKNRTASDASVEHVIQRAHEKGLQVMLKPFVDAEGGEWRGTFRPSNIDAWFKSYTAMAVHYAEMAERLKVESYLIGAEYVSLSGSEYADRWREVAKAVREKYKGQIGYGANWDNQKGTPEFELVTWWDAVDFIGIHGYFPLTKKNDATLDDMMVGIAPWVARVEALQKKYNKPVVFTEAGYKSCDGGTRIPWWCNPNAPVDLQEQSDGTEAILKAYQNKPWFKGIFWWMWNIKPNEGGVTDKDHNLNHKPALAVIRKYWGTTSVLLNPKFPLLVGEGGGEVQKVNDPYYSKPRLSSKQEKQWEQKMWNGIKKSFNNRQPKLKAGEWTKALFAYVYGGYPIDVIREALHYHVTKKYPAPYWLLPAGVSCSSSKTCGIHPMIQWSHWR